MDPGFLITSVLGGVMGGRRKKSGKALRYLTGSRGSVWANPSLLLGAAGVAWGVLETLQNQGSGVTGASGPFPPAPAPGQPSSGPGASPHALVPPPLPQTAVRASAAPDEATLRIVRLAISAAFADGSVNEHERAAILQQARSAGAGDIIEQELRYPKPVADIAAGVTDPAQRATLYVLAFTILRADEQLSASERIYLTQLATVLGLEPQTVAALEKDVGDRIDALGDQDQPGG